ncbi:DUF2312 domain-containing protein [Bradyrhizobium sp. BR 10261]|uniref:DUF2312 domain-containing protein n=1 Tax=Bradyrhizobium sp. BR 10261 TaxID=2749992 RepID=UPI001C64F0C5|nr:DUF2312 domain-containing protein [Bradyrhizobium sp. BR 10261]
MTALKSETVDRLKTFLEAIDSLEGERAEIGDEIRAQYAEAKAQGFDPKAIRSMVKRRRAKNPDQIAEDEQILETYMHAVGMLPENPLAAAIAALASDELGRDQVIDGLKQMVPAGREIIAKVGGDPVRIWRDAEGVAFVEPWTEPKAPKVKTGRKASATVLSIVPKSDPVKDAADRAERRSRGEPDPDDEGDDE